MEPERSDVESWKSTPWHKLPTWGKWTIGIVGALLLLGIGVAVGKGGEEDSLKEEVAQLTKERDAARGEVRDIEEGQTEEFASLEEELEAERSINGEDTSSQDASGEYETDFAWETAGRVGYLTIKPISLDKEGEHWILTVEAKNEGSQPRQPFCGGAEAILIDAENNNYSGEAVISEGADNCGEELQPGLTGTFKSEFKLPSGAKPVAAAIYGDYEQEDEAKTWELPH
jgi:hypothetical protein